LPEIQLALSIGEKVENLKIGLPGIRTHSLLAILLGTAVYRGTRMAVISEMLRLIVHRGPYKASRECLTPVLHDLPSLIPLVMVAARALLLPRSVEQLAAATVKDYSITGETIDRLRLGFSPKHNF
jgi:hypothetical protein